MNRRAETRTADNAETEVTRISADACRARIEDVSCSGVRLWTEQPLDVDENISCRVQFDRRTDDMPLRVVWARREDSGWVCGAVYAPIVPQTNRLIDSYWLYVNHKRDHGGASTLWAS